MNTTNENYKDIPGWGMDADPENEPTYPMKDYTGDDHNRIRYERAAQQPVTTEILQSNERPAPTAVFGTSVPPSGLSGMIRRYAFQHSEDRYRHWLPLIFADRVNVIEGYIDDVKSGHFPNIFAEKGYKAAWKYNKAGLISKLCITLVVTGVVLSTLSKSKR